MFTQRWRRPALMIVVALLLSGLASGLLVVAAPVAPSSISYWGINLYLTKAERTSTKDNRAALAAMARSAGVQWTREELPWDLIEPNNGNFKTLYDEPLRYTAERGFGIIGMLLTTPGWARDGACAGNYWCPPANVNEYGQFAGWMAERYDGDGVSDAPGSPRVAVWELWNEPNTTGTWPVVGGGENGRRQRYGQLMVAAYRAIKAADPSAIVLTGGVYIYDGSYCAPSNCDGLNFLSGVFQQTPEARSAFDALSIHPYIPTERPDAPNIPRLITVEGRVRNARSWLNGNGRSDAPVWITEMGWCTASGVCPGGVQVSEDQQANYLVRSLVIAQHNGVQHANWFQFDDAFNNPQREWGNAAIVRDWNGSSYPPKPAYDAYRALAGQLTGAAVAGTGPLHTHVYDPSQPYSGSGGTYDYRYTRGDTVIDVLWRPNDSLSARFPVIAGKSITLVQRDGARTALTPSGGAVQLTLSERPIMIVQGGAAPQLVVAPQTLTLLAEAGAASASADLVIDSSGGVINWTAGTSTSWLSLGETSGSGLSAVKVRANTQGFAAGGYAGSITVTGSDGAGTRTVPVQLLVVPSLKHAYIPLIRR
jgi:hypothetical protein